MSKGQGGFDAIGVVVDWIDACRERRLSELLDLYEKTAIVECCEGDTFRGRAEIERYWQAKLVQPVVGAFEIDALYPTVHGVSLDYRGYNGVPVRTHFQFNDVGKIQSTACAPIRLAA